MLEPAGSGHRHQFNEEADHDQQAEGVSSLKSQDHFSNDVFLNLVGAAQD